MIASRSTRHVRLFKIGRTQAFRIPRGFELPGTEALLHSDDNGRLILEPIIHRPDILDLLATWKQRNETDQMPPIPDPPPEDPFPG